MTEPEIFAVDADHCLAGAGDLVVMFVDQPPAPTIARAEEALVRFAAARRDVSLIIVASAEAPLPDAATRAALERLARAGPAQLRCLAFVLEGEGLRAAALRSLMTFLGMTMLNSVPMTINRTVDDALSWIERTLGDRGPEVARQRDQTTRAARVRFANRSRSDSPGALGDRRSTDNVRDDKRLR